MHTWPAIGGAANAHTMLQLSGDDRYSNLSVAGAPVHAPTLAA
eukprot:SAG22_NODE_21803_length_254_cov_0.632258_1_plen_42_part_10